MKYNFLILTGLVLLISGCSTVKKNSTTKAFPVSDFPGEKEFTVVYNLPRTTVQFEIETTRMVTRRGPFFQYAEKYLGITEVPTVDSKSWHISGVSITTSQEADPEKYFVLTAQNNHSFAYLNLAKAGFILPVHQPQINPVLPGFKHHSMNLKPLFLQI